jgi:hypoxanthine phosphoribosyltransferase
MRQTEIYPIRLSRRVQDVVTYESPHWLVEPPSGVIKGCRVLVVDEICDSGETILMVKEKLEAMGAEAVRSAVLYAHTWKASAPDYIGIITDRLILNPWDREILVDGAFQFHPEYADALVLQGIQPDPSLLIEATDFKIAKAVDEPDSKQSKR